MGLALGRSQAPIVAAQRIAQVRDDLRTSFGLGFLRVLDRCSEGFMSQGTGNEAWINVEIGTALGGGVAQALERQARFDFPVGDQPIPKHPKRVSEAAANLFVTIVSAMRGSRSRTILQLAISEAPPAALDGSAVVGASRAVSR